MPSKRDFEPLMASIERTLAALGQSGRYGERLTQPPRSCGTLYNVYLECCCRRAHVVKEEEYSA